MRGAPAHVELLPVAEQVLARLLTAAMSRATPAEVMPMADGASDWNEAHRHGFVAYHRSHRSLPLHPSDEVTYAIEHSGEIVGALRLALTDEPGELEVGLWLGQHARGRGVGRAALAAAAVRAADMGAQRVIARTSAANPAAVAALRACGFTVTYLGAEVLAAHQLR